MNVKIRCYRQLSFFILALFLSVSLGLNSPLWGATADKERIPALIEGAKKEGKFVWYTQVQLSESTVLIKKFEEKYPFLKTEIIRLNGPKLLNKVLSETAGKKYLSDVITTQGFTFHIMKKKGLLLKHMSPESVAYEEGAKDPDGYGTSIDMNTKIIAYNTNLVAKKDVPKSYEDILDPKWRRKFAFDTNNYEWFGNMLKIMGREKGIDLMIKLSKNQPLVRTGSTLRVTLLSAGEFPLGVPVNGERVESMKALGARIDWVWAEPVVALKEMNGIAARAPHPHAATLFTDFILSKEGQEIMKNAGRIPTRSDVESKAPRLTKGGKLYWSDHSLAEYYEEMTREYDDIFVRKTWKGEKW